MSNSVPERDLDYQVSILDGVSRTFALTIPQLPPDLRIAVGNAYLLCRIADTIEDEPAVTQHEKQELSARFARAVEGSEDAHRFALELHETLGPATTASERDLVLNAGRVLGITNSLQPAQRRAIARCIKVMTTGMVHFQEGANLRGLADFEQFDRYCYYVAGVVGEMLTELFCVHSREIGARRDELMKLGRSFGQGLQMTNILKDVWEDRSRGVCWLPRSAFPQQGFDLALLSPGDENPGFADGLNTLVAIARHHLANACRYVLIIPAHETGIRRFCMWAVALAVLTLRRIHANPGYSSGREVTISRRSVATATSLVNAAVRFNPALAMLFHLLSLGLPPATRGPGGQGGPDDMRRFEGA